MNKEVNNQPMEYENRIVVFIDILGFTDMINNSSIPHILNSLESVHKLKDETLFSEYYEKNYPGNPDTTDKQVTIFSDSIVISFLNTNQDGMGFDIRNFFSSISALQSDIACYNKKLIRGGITEGQLYHKGNICFGPALIKAYKLESEIAKHPRIMIDKVIIEKYDLKYIDNYISSDKDGHYIDFLKIFIKAIHFPERGEESILFYLLEFQELINDGLNSESDSVKGKYIWLANKFNNVVEPAFKKEGPIEWHGKTLIPITIK